MASDFSYAGVLTVISSNGTTGKVGSSVSINIFSSLVEKYPIRRVSYFPLEY
jgi:hypothetical protein